MYFLNTKVVGSVITVYHYPFPFNNNDNFSLSSFGYFTYNQVDGRLYRCPTGIFGTVNIGLNAARQS